MQRLPTRRQVTQWWLRCWRKWCGWPEWVKITGLGAVLAWLRFPEFLVGRTIFYGDNYSLLVPGKIFTAQWLRQGVLPLWNPTILAGISWIGDISQSIFYPSTLLFVVLPPAAALNLTVWLHFLLSFVGMFYLARSWKVGRYASLAAAILWVFSTQMLGASNNLATMQSLAWFPWVFWASVKLGREPGLKSSLVLAVLGAIQIAAGYPTHLVYWLAPGIFLSAAAGWGNQSQNWRRWLSWAKNWAVGLGLMLGLSAVFWLPFYPTLMESTRMSQTAEQSLVGGMQPVMLLKIIIPTLFYSLRDGVNWGAAWGGSRDLAFYLSWLGLIVLAWSLPRLLWREKALLTVVGGGLLLALGASLPFYPALVQLLPLGQAMRYPSTAVSVVNLVLCLLLARSLDWPDGLNQLKRQRWIGSVLLVVVGLSALGWILVHYDFAQVWSVLNDLSNSRLINSPFHTMERDYKIALMVSGSLVTAAGLAWATWQALIKQRRLLFLVFLALDLWFATSSQVMTAPNRIYDDWQQSILPTDLVQPEAVPSRWITRNFNQPYTDFGTYWEALAVRQPFSDSFIDQLELQTFANLTRLQSGAAPDWNMPLQLPMLHGYTTLLPQDYAQVWNQQLHDARINFLAPIAINNPLLAEWSVRYYLVDRGFVVKEPIDLPIIWQQEPLMLYELPSLPRVRDVLGNQLRISDYQENPNQISFDLAEETTLATSRDILIADRFDVGWRAWVNGRPTELGNQQGMRKLVVPTASASVVLKYQPREFQLGLWMSAASGLSMGFAWVITKLRS